MSFSLFDLFSIGIGPSSSHTVGPMRAAKRFIQSLLETDLVAQVHSLRVQLYGSLGLTGKGHGTDKALILGLQGYTPEGVDVDAISEIIATAKNKKKLHLSENLTVPFDEKNTIVFHRSENLPLHSNGLIFEAFDENAKIIFSKTYYSIGGGFVIEDCDFGKNTGAEIKIPFPFKTAAELLEIGKKNNLKISQIMLANEVARYGNISLVHEKIKPIWQAMQACVVRGCQTGGILPGGLKVERRAPQLYHRLTTRAERALKDPLTIMDWVNLYALAVNEENAAGGRIVTAPTNGAAGIIPAVLHYVDRFTDNNSFEDICEFILTAGAIGLLYKMNASLSGAEVGCQGEVGVACSMAAAGLAAVQGGTNEQIENAAEIGMEHNLGLTCDPIGGLVQIPCIERNAMGAMKAINAARIALSGDGSHKVSLDKVIQTMLDTGRDMQTKYKETSQGGLAMNVVEC